MNTSEPAFWLLFNTTFTGREDPPEGGGDGGDGGDDPDDPDDPDPDEGKLDDKDAELERLRKIVTEERKGRREEKKARRKAERELQSTATKKVEDEENEKLTQTQTQLNAEKERNQKLATRLLTKERDDAILAEARTLGFIDPTDALTDDIRKAVEFDQDEDDPSDIDIDENSVKVAVKKLAETKKHLIGAPNEGEPTGGSFRKKRKGEPGKLDDNKLREDYPSLR